MVRGRSGQNWHSAVTEGKSLWRTKSKNKSKPKTKQKIATRKTRTKLSTRSVCTSVYPLLSLSHTQSVLFFHAVSCCQAKCWLFFMEYTNSKIVIYVFCSFRGGGNRRQASVFQNGFVLKQAPKNQFMTARLQLHHHENHRQQQTQKQQPKQKPNALISG